jgi:formamidopyrimidine-DNA glycosylase
MSNKKSVDEFLNTTVSAYGLEPLTSMRRRELKFKLGMADIKDYVAPEDVTLALDLVLAELQPKTSSVKTASSGYGRLQPCPRCNTPMSGVKLSNAANAHYCASCHVAIPSL